MAIEVISGKEAMKFLKENKNSRYPTPQINKERLFPFPKPEAAPSFSINKSSNVFTMGSCFAREVDKALVSSGFNVISRSTNLSKAVERSGADESLYNKYTIHSIVNELRWALDPEHPYDPSLALVQISEDNWTDPQLGGSAFASSYESMCEFRASYCDSIARAKDADVIIITLGLVEAWYDKKSKLYLNLAPHPRALKNSPERFEMRVLDYNEIVSELQEFYAITQRFCKPDVKILITVSPVPLLATFRDQDVLVANTYSKAVQRAAVEYFIRQHDNIDYFPSFEFVTLGDPNHNWSGDYRHVSPHVVQRIMGSVMSKYTQGIDFQKNILSSEINYLYQKEQYSEIISRFEQNPSVNLTLTATYRIGLSYKHSGKTPNAFVMFERCLQLDESYKPALQNALSAAAQLGLSEKFNKLLADHEKYHPDESEFRRAKLAQMLNS
ncbi:GSCFA family protein [Pseudomonas sp. S37]|uniref:GSCFA domain-containing protein n=1 Tax=Pseudomonas sp. S37 TaxID=2767449 RepID=UPI0019132E98|nr:GSCFA domain-containing protein [Pseudomonas sp. S37]MBK4995963.1 GSCFA family protein [Pseudomonas sp. S37]